MKRKWPHLHHCPSVLICCLLHLYDGDCISVFSDDKVDFIAISIPLRRLSRTRNLELVLLCFPSTTYLWWVQIKRLGSAATCVPLFYLSWSSVHKVWRQYPPNFSIAKRSANAKKESYQFRHLCPSPLFVGIRSNYGIRAIPTLRSHFLICWPLRYWKYGGGSNVLPL